MSFAIQPVWLQKKIIGLKIEIFNRERFLFEPALTFSCENVPFVVREGTVSFKRSIENGFFRSLSPLGRVWKPQVFITCQLVQVAV